MQVYLPYKSYTRSVKVLDDKTLNAQKSSIKTILKSICLLYDKSSIVFNEKHPLVMFWFKRPDKLMGIYVQTIKELTLRGHPQRNTMDEICKTLIKHKSKFSKEDIIITKKIQEQYRAILYKKNPRFYSEFRECGKKYADIRYHPEEIENKIITLKVIK